MVFIRSFNRDSDLSNNTNLEYPSVPEIRIHFIPEANLKPIALEAHRSGAGQSVASMVLDQPTYRPYLCAQLPAIDTHEMVPTYDVLSVELPTNSSS